MYGLEPLIESNLSVWSGTPQEMGGFADDPIVGRQTCPSLTRLNLGIGKSEPLLLSSIGDRNYGEKSKSWIFHLRPGLYWWDGSPVTRDDVIEFVQKALPSAVARVGGGLWQIPSFSIEKIDLNAFEIRWATAPLFGQFVLNGIPFARLARHENNPRNLNRIECAGLYIPEVSNKKLRLFASPSYKAQKSLPTIEIELNRESVAVNRQSSVVDFVVRVTGIWNYKKSAECAIGADNPIVTAIIWNQALGVTQDSGFRQTLNQLIPRAIIGEIIGSQFVTPRDTLVLRAMPSPQSRISGSKNVEEYARLKEARIEVLAARLQEMGYVRPDPRGPRLDRVGKPIELEIATRSRQFGLIEKVIEDVFSSVGINVRFVINSTHPVGFASHHGILSTLSIDWPGSNLLTSLHSQSKDRGVLQGFYSNPNLDHALEYYARSLTFLKPDFKALEAIDTELRKIAGMSILLQHRVCIDIEPKGKFAVQENPFQNPDWFRNLLLTL